MTSDFNERCNWHFLWNSFFGIRRESYQTQDQYPSTEFNICHETSTEFQIKSIKIVCLLTAVFTQSSLMDLLLKILKQMSGNKLLCAHVHRGLFPLKYSYGLIDNRELL